MENFILSSTPIEVSEFANHKEATFLISVLDEYNSNDVLIEKAEGEKYHNTILGYPILAYLKYDKDGKPDDFGGHEVRAKYNSETKEIDYYFATHPIGSVLESWVEKREVEGYEGEKDVILIKTKLWKSRFPEYFKVFDNLWSSGTLASSWEISSSETEKTSRGKILKTFEFIGNAILGSSVKGAVKSAGVLEVASENQANYELSNAFLQDIQKSSNEDSISSEDNPTDEIDINKDLNNHEGGKNMSEEQNKKELSALNDNDLYTRVRRAINSTNEDKYYYSAMLYPYEYKCISYSWDRESQEDFVEFTYSVNSDDTISITSQQDVKMMFVPTEEINTQVSELEGKIATAEKEIAEAGKSITELSTEKEGLESQIAELEKYKEQVLEMEKAENERLLSEKKIELKDLTLEDSLIAENEIEEDEKLALIFSELTLENFEISQEKIEVIKGKKAIAKYKKDKTKSKEEELETSSNDKQEKAKTDLNNDSEGILTATEIIKSMLSKK